MKTKASATETPLDSGSVPSDTAGGAVWAGAALVGSLTLVVFLPALRNGFVNLDDVENFLANRHYRGLGWANLRWMLTSAHMGHYIPIAWSTLGMDYVLWGMNPFGYHLTSLVLHAVNAVLVYVLALRLLGPALPAPSPAALPLGAAVAALLFSLHPLRVESVAWVTERRDLVCGLFTLATVLAYVSSCRRGMAGRLHAGRLVAALAFFALALLSKSIVVGLPMVLLALDYHPLGRMSCTEARPSRHFARLVIEKVPFLVLSATVSAAMLMIGSRDVLTPLATLGIAHRLAVSGYGLFFYLWKTVVPWRLSPLYELHYPVVLLTPGYVLPGVAVAAIVAGVVRARRRWPAGLTAWLAYVILLLPVLGITHNGMQIAADRYTYLACLGWALLAGAGVTWCWRASQIGAITHRVGRLVGALSATAIMALGALSTLQIRVWHDSETLWRHALAVDPPSAVAHYNLGGALWLLGRPQESRAELERAVALLPDRLANGKAVFHTSLGLLLHQQGDIEGAERYYRAALGFSEDNILARHNLGVIYALRGDRSASLDSFRHVLRVSPGHASACANGRRLAEILGVKPKELGSCPALTEKNRNSSG